MTLSMQLYKRSHLEKTPRKPLAGAEPATLGLSFHCLPAEIALQRTASVHPPTENKDTLMTHMQYNKL